MNKLWARLALGFLLLTWAMLAGVFVVMQATVQSSFRTYVAQRDAMMWSSGLAAALEEHYAAAGSWEGAAALLDQMQPGHGMGGRRGMGGPQALLAGPDHTVVAAANPALVGRPLPAGSALVELRVGGALVGYLAQQTPAAASLGAAERSFLARMRLALLAAAALAGVLAPLVGVALARRLARPLERLAQHMASASPGRLDSPAPLEGAEEVQRLAAAFNDLAARLAAAEAERRRLTADAAHELRTPVAVLRGHLEALMDGVYPLTPERLAVAYDETLHLGRLVDDLRLLTLAEGGRLPLARTQTEPAELLSAAAARFAPLAEDAGVRLHTAVAPGLPPLALDRGRMQQVLDNLLANALRHVSPGGRISLAAAAQGAGVRLTVANSGDLPPNEAAHVFDRFWRAEGAARRDEGGSGLGLAISRQLVRLHGGELVVETVPGETRFVATLPRAA